MGAKPKVAFFDFASCEGCQLQVVNLEEAVIGVAELVDIVEFREAVTGKAPEYDIAFIEGAITRDEDEKRVKDVRARTKILVAFGQCACTGGVLRLKNNNPSLDNVKKIVYGDKYNMPHLDTYATKAVNEVVKVDLYLPGCPVNREELVRFIKEIGLGMIPKLPNYPVCVECKLKENECLFDLGQICLGPLARAGCNAVCPSSTVTCMACRGTVDNPNKDSMHEILEKYNYTVDEIKRKINLFGVDPEVKK